MELTEKDGLVLGHKNVLSEILINSNRWTVKIASERNTGKLMFRFLRYILHFEIESHYTKRNTSTR